MLGGRDQGFGECWVVDKGFCLDERCGKKRRTVRSVVLGMMVEVLGHEYSRMGFE